MTAVKLANDLRSTIGKTDYNERLVAIRAKVQTIQVQDGVTDNWDSHHDHSNHVDNNETNGYKPNRLSDLLKSKLVMTSLTSNEINAHSDYTVHSDFSDTGVS